MAPFCWGLERPQAEKHRGNQQRHRDTPAHACGPRSGHAACPEDGQRADDGLTDVASGTRVHLEVAVEWFLVLAIGVFISSWVIRTAVHHGIRDADKKRSQARTTEARSNA